jgi:hypothetical protein
MTDTAPRAEMLSPVTEAHFDTPSRKGWEFFTKFLLWNAVTIAAALVFVGLLTVWR